jgi:hypothetical protein
MKISGFEMSVMDMAGLVLKFEVALLIVNLIVLPVLGVIALIILSALGGLLGG